MTTLSYPTPSTLASVTGAVRRLVPGLHWLRIALAEQRRAARQRREHALLDQHALRDLGITRGELDSYAAEARCAVARTRLRVYDDRSPWWAP